MVAVVAVVFLVVVVLVVPTGWPGSYEWEGVQRRIDGPHFSAPDI